MVSGIDGVLLLMVVGDGKLVVPIDFAVRRPNPKGPGARCREQTGAGRRSCSTRRTGAWADAVSNLPAMVVADSWFSDSKLMAHVAPQAHHATILVQGKATYVFNLEDGRKVHGR